MKNTNKGSVLIISLVIMMIAMSLVLFIIKITKDIIYSSELIIDKLNAKIKAESEIERLKYIFLTGHFGNYYFKPSIYYNLYPKTILLNGTPFSIDNDISISILDTSAKINLFVYTEEKRLKNVFQVLMNKKNSLVLADTYLDWVDTDSFTRLGGAEIDYYLQHTKYTPRNNLLLQDIEELLNIKGYTEDIYKKIKKYLTLSYTGGDINLYLVNERILRTISFIDKATIDTIANLKKQNKLKKLKLIIQKYPALTEIFSTEPSKVVEFSIEAKSGKAIEKIYCIIDFKETKREPYTVYKYKE